MTSPGTPGAETAPRIQDNLIAYMRLFAGLAGMTMQDDTSFWLISNKPAPGNAVLKTRWTRQRVEERIEEVLHEIAQHTDHIDWMLFPGDQPGDLGARLEARGMPGGSGGHWLWCDLTSLGPAPQAPTEFRIEQVRDDHAMKEWVRVSEAGFGADLACFYSAYARHGYGPDARSLHYTGYLGDTPVTSGTILDAGGSAAVYDLSTPPDFRRQGVGGGLTHHLMRAIRQRGYAATWIWSSAMARSLYQKLGYADADFGVREHEWRQRPAPTESRADSR